MPVEEHTIESDLVVTLFSNTKPGSKLLLPRTTSPHVRPSHPPGPIRSHHDLERYALGGGGGGVDVMFCHKSAEFRGGGGGDAGSPVNSAAEFGLLLLG